MQDQSRQPRPDPFAFEDDDGVIDLRARVGELSPERCVELLESTPIGRVGFLTDKGPLVLPVNFAWHDHSIVFRTLSRQKLATVAETPSVCFEIDHWDADERSGWSVVVRGEAREVTQWAEREQLEHIGLVPWARDAWRPMWVRISVEEITGRVLR